MDLIKSIFKGDKVIWIIFGLLCVISIIEVFSAASTLTYKTGDHWGPIKHHSTLLLMGLGIMILVHNIPYKWFKLAPIVLLPLSGILLVAVSLMGVMTNGAARWMTLFGFQFQPSELGKMAVVMAVALILSKGQTEEGAGPNAFKYILWVSLPIILLIMPENLSTAGLLFGVVILMMFIGRISNKTMAKFLAPLFIAGILGVGALMAIPKDTDIKFLHRFETWQARVDKFFFPVEVPAAKYDTNKDGQVAHARIAVATSNILGKGPGNSVQRDFLSQAFSDFIFAIVIEELGLVGAIIVVALYIWLLIRVGKLARKCKHPFPIFLILGIGLLLVSQALLNMLVAVGLFPVTGQPLPLISRGGTSIFINCAYMGMILSVSRYAARLEQEDENPLGVIAEDTEEEALYPISESLNDDTTFENY